MRKVMKIQLPERSMFQICTTVLRMFLNMEIYDS